MEEKKEGKRGILACGEEPCELYRPETCDVGGCYLDDLADEARDAGFIDLENG